MASSSRSRRPIAPRKPRVSRRPRKTQLRKRIEQPENAIDNARETSSSSSSSSTNAGSVITNCSDIGNSTRVVTDDRGASPPPSGCSTPKAERFRIPEIVVCPPAPKKQRPVVSNCSLQRRPIAFFAPPDLELFFFFALGDISV